MAVPDMEIVAYALLFVWTAVQSLLAIEKYNEKAYTSSMIFCFSSIFHWWTLATITYWYFLGTLFEAMTWMYVAFGWIYLAIGVGVMFVWSIHRPQIDFVGELF